MSAPIKKATPAAAVRAPEEIVELDDLLDLDGAKVRARVRRVSQVAIATAFQGVDAPAPQVGPKSKREIKASEFEQGEAALVRVIELAVVEPEFRLTPGDGQLPISYLSSGDQLKLVQAIKRVAGFKEVAAPTRKFRHDDGAGLAVRGGDRVAGTGERPDAVGGRERSASRVQPHGAENGRGGAKTAAAAGR